MGERKGRKVKMLLRIMSFIWLYSRSVKIEANRTIAVCYPNLFLLIKNKLGWCYMPKLSKKSVLISGSWTSSG